MRVPHAHLTFTTLRHRAKLVHQHEGKSARHWTRVWAGCQLQGWPSTHSAPLFPSHLLLVPCTQSWPRVHGAGQPLLGQSARDWTRVWAGFQLEGRPSTHSAPPLPSHLLFEHICRAPSRVTASPSFATAGSAESSSSAVVHRRHERPPRQVTSLAVIHSSIQVIAVTLVSHASRATILPQRAFMGWRVVAFHSPWVALLSRAAWLSSAAATNGRLA